MSLATRRLHAILRPSLSYSGCRRCWRSWRIAEGHYTEYKAWTAEDPVRRSCFPLCRECWAELTPDERLPYYRQLVEKWSGDSAERWPEVEAAVRAGR